MTTQALKTIRSYSGLARFLPELGEVVGYIPRQTSVPSPYRYSPTDAVYDWNGRKVFYHETKHKVYEVHAVPATETLTTDEAATEVFLARRKIWTGQ